MARLLQRIIEPPHPCSYLPDRRAQIEVHLMVDVSAAELEALLSRGWRRFGPVYFRPVCRSCQECITLRVDVTRFAPSRNQRRAGRKAARLRRVVSVPRVDGQRMALHARWHAQREAARGWEPSLLDEERYHLDFAYPHPAVREAAFYDDAQGGRLVALGIFDATPEALSAVYFFHDPDYHRDSLGTANIVALAEDARASGRRWLYLGYRVAGCPSLRYKARFGPHQLLRGRPSSFDEPHWIDGAAPDPER